MIPVTQHERCRIPFRSKHRIQFHIILSQALERTSSLRRWVNQKWSTHSVIVVGTEVRVVPVKAVL